MSDKCLHTVESTRVTPGAFGCPVTLAVILAGGRGTRLGSLTSDMPKPLLPVGGVPFLEYVIWNLTRSGITDIILSTGYCGHRIRQYFGDGSAHGVRITYAEEPSPLGTGGGVAFAASGLTAPFFVVNGDTLLDCSFPALASMVHSTKAKAGLALRHVDDAGRFGTIALKGEHITGFFEKGAQGPGLINGGVYLLTPEALRLLPPGGSSLETDLFPLLAKAGELVGSVCEGFFWDMGLPETYAEAQTLLPAWKAKYARPAVFLDRDGTLIVEKNYLHDPAEVELLPGVVQGLTLLQQHGYLLLVLTNQAGIGRGYYTVKDMHAVNAHLAKLLSDQGVTLDNFYFCPHAPKDTCTCRKPELGMLHQALRIHSVALADSWMIGDKECDIGLGKAAGMQTTLVRTGYGHETEKECTPPSFIANSLDEAARRIVTHAAHPPQPPHPARQT